MKRLPHQKCFIGRTQYGNSNPRWGRVGSFITCCTQVCVVLCVDQSLIYLLNTAFLKKNWRTSVLLLGPLIPLFWTSGYISSGFQSQSGQPYSQRHTWCTFLDIHLWWNTCWPLGCTMAAEPYLWRSIGLAQEQNLFELSLNSALFCQIDSISSIWQNQSCMVVHGTGDCFRHRWYRRRSDLTGRASDL